MLLAHVARALDPREGVHLDALVEIDRPVLGVDHDHRVHDHAGGDVDVVPVAAESRGLLDGPFNATPADGDGNRAVICSGLARIRSQV